MGEPIRIAICDDHPVFRAGLVGLLRDEPDLDIAFEAGSARELRDRIAGAPVDVLLLDLQLPDEHGLAVLPAITDRCRAVIVSAFDDPVQIRRAFEHGAVGFVRKDAAACAILDA
ncbi:MAG TPA: response regulator transcription factor, partial [Kofleriaceae bacterium]